MSDAWAIQVNAGPVELRKPERGGNYCVFTFVFRIGAVNHRLVERYSVLREFHSRLSSTRNYLPPFPPKSWLFQSTTDIKFQEQRKESLLNYFKSLVKEPCILKLELFHSLLMLPDNLKRKMVKIAEDLDSKKYILEQHLGGGYSSSTSDYKDSPHRNQKNQQGKYGNTGMRQLKGGTRPLGHHSLESQQQVTQRQQKETLQSIERERINNVLKEIHNKFKKSFPEKVQDDEELDTEVDELKEHSKVERYEKAIKDYRIFTLEEVIPEISKTSSAQHSPRRVMFC